MPVEIRYFVFTSSHTLRHLHLDLESRTPKNIASLSGHAGGIRELAPHPAASTFLLASLGDDGHVLLWQLPLPTAPPLAHASPPSLSQPTFLARIAPADRLYTHITWAWAGDSGRATPAAPRRAWLCCAYSLTSEASSSSSSSSRQISLYGIDIFQGVRRGTRSSFISDSSPTPTSATDNSLTSPYALPSNWSPSWNLACSFVPPESDRAFPLIGLSAAPISLAASPSRPTRSPSSSSLSSSSYLLPLTSVPSASSSSSAPASHSAVTLVGAMSTGVLVWLLLLQRRPSHRHRVLSPFFIARIPSSVATQPVSSSPSPGFPSAAPSPITCVDVHRDLLRAEKGSNLAIFIGSESGLVSVWTLALNTSPLTRGQKPPSASALLIALDDPPAARLSSPRDSTESSSQFALLSSSSRPVLAAITRTLTQSLHIFSF